MKIHVIAMAVGFLLDCCLGDPHNIYHPVQAMGVLIEKGEKAIRGCLPKSKNGELAGGFCLVCFLVFSTAVFAYGLLWAASLIHPAAAIMAESVMCGQMIAAKSLKAESMKVYESLKRQDVEGARKAVSMIVGRDTEPLSRDGIIKAAVETVAENTSDGVIAPLFYMALGGGALGYLYKAVNTMDSMIGYKNDRYLYFGSCAAKLDDLVNLVPARLSAVFMIAAAFLLEFCRIDGYKMFHGKNAVKIFIRDRYCHKSPNSAQTEAVCAGALGVQLAGPAYYFGKMYQKPLIGDDLRPVEPEDIQRAGRLMMTASVLAVAVFGAAVWLVS